MTFLPYYSVPVGVVGVAIDFRTRKQHFSGTEWMMVVVGQQQSGGTSCCSGREGATPELGIIIKTDVRKRGLRDGIQFIQQPN